MYLVKELWNFLRVRKKFWLAPIITVLVILSGLLAVTAASGIFSGFIYPLF